MLANYYWFKEEELFDEDTKNDLERIRREMPNGDKVVKRFNGRMRQIKRAYTLTITRLVTDYFFTHTESRESFIGFKKDGFERRIKAAYDLRSQYVHTGIEFGRWLSPDGHYLNEIQLGEPVVDDKQHGEAIKLAPLYFGLERIMRFCLLTFIHLHGVRLDDRLDGPPPSTSTAPEVVDGQKPEAEGGAAKQECAGETFAGDHQTLDNGNPGE